MKKKILCLALLGAMGAAQAVMANDFDDRWYIDGSVGYNFQDNHRNTDNTPFATIGVGKPLSPNWGIELNFNYQNAHEPDHSGGHWQQDGLAIDVLYHFIIEGARWNPYVRAGLGWQHNEEDYLTVRGDIGSPLATHKSDNLAADFGLGLEAKYGRYGVRTEFGVRYDRDDNSVVDPRKNFFVDELLSVGVTVALGPEPMKAV